MTEHHSKNTNNLTDNKLVNAAGLIEALFAEGSRPSVRWVRKMQKLRIIPCQKIYGLVVFDIRDVRETLKKNNTIKARNNTWRPFTKVKTPAYIGHRIDNGSPPNCQRIFSDSAKAWAYIAASFSVRAIEAARRIHIESNFNVRSQLICFIISGGLH